MNTFNDIGVKFLRVQSKLRLGKRFAVKATVFPFADSRKTANGS